MDWLELQKWQQRNLEGKTLTDTPADSSNTPPVEQPDATTDPAYVAPPTGDGVTPVGVTALAPEGTAQTVNNGDGTFTHVDADGNEIQTVDGNANVISGDIDTSQATYATPGTVDEADKDLNPFSGQTDPAPVAPTTSSDAPEDSVQTTEAPAVGADEEVAPVDGPQANEPEEAAPVNNPEPEPADVPEPAEKIDNPYRKGDAIFESEDTATGSQQREGVVLDAHDDGSVTIGWYASVERISIGNVQSGTATNPA